MTKKIASIVVAIILGLVGYAQAFPVVGSVHLEGGYDPNLKEGTATYTFFNLDNPFTNFNLTGLMLYFEGDVFNLTATSVDGASLPAGWDVETGGIPGSGQFAFELAYVSGLPGISEGGALTFNVNYKLWGPASTLSWLEGGAWEQGFLALSGGLPIGFGSTSPAPEPTSLLLLGSGLAGLGLLRRRRIRARPKL